MPTADEPSSTTVRIPVALDDELIAERNRRPRGQRPSKGELLAQAWERSRRAPAAPDSSSTLTEDQADILAILSEDPKRALLFQAVQTTVKHALEEYREKWKPKAHRKKTPGHLHDQRSAS